MPLLLSRCCYSTIIATRSYTAKTFGMKKWPPFFIKSSNIITLVCQISVKSKDFEKIDKRTVPNKCIAGKIYLYFSKFDLDYIK